MALWRHRSRKCRVITKVHSDMKYSGMPQNYQKMFRNYINQAISAPLHININIIIRIKTYSFLSITFIPKISLCGYKLMEF